MQNGSTDERDLSARPQARDHRSSADSAARPSLGDRIYAARDRLLSSPRFQTWAASFPLTRWHTERHSRQLFDLCAGFVYSQVLFACVRLDLFEKLAEKPLTLTEIATSSNLSTAAAARLLAAAVSLDLLTRRRGDRFGLGLKGAALRGNPAVVAMIEHHALLYKDLQDPVTLLRGEAGETALAKYWPYAAASAPADLDPEQVTAYTNLMATSQALVSGDILAAYPFERHACLLDVGGGSGAFLRAAAQRAPGLQLQLFDLPAVVERATESLLDAGLAQRIHITGGSFKSDALPVGADIATLIRILFDHDDDAALTILKAVRKALPDNGVLLIAEPLRGTRRADAIGDAYFGFYLLAMGRGRLRSVEDFRQLLGSAGFTRVRQLQTRRPVLTGLIAAYPGPS